MSGGAWLTQDPVLPGRMGLLTQVCVDDNDVVLRTVPCSALASCAGKSEQGEGSREHLGYWSEAGHVLQVPAAGNSWVLV